MEMGHRDEIVIAEGNFPAASPTQRLVRCDGFGAPLLLDAILQLLKLDSSVEQSVVLVSVVPGDNHRPEIRPVYRRVILDHAQGFSDFELMECHAFCEHARKTYAVLLPVNWSVKPT